MDDRGGGWRADEAYYDSTADIDAITKLIREKKFDGTPAELKAKDPSGKLDVVFRNLTMKQ